MQSFVIGICALTELSVSERATWNCNLSPSRAYPLSVFTAKRRGPSTCKDHISYQRWCQQYKPRVAAPSAELSWKSMQWLDIESLRSFLLPFCYTDCLTRRHHHAWKLRIQLSCCAILRCKYVHYGWIQYGQRPLMIGHSVNWWPQGIQTYNTYRLAIFQWWRLAAIQSKHGCMTAPIYPTPSCKQETIGSEFWSLDRLSRGCLLHCLNPLIGHQGRCKRQTNLNSMIILWQIC